MYVKLQCHNYKYCWCTVLGHINSKTNLPKGQHVASGYASQNWWESIIMASCHWPISNEDFHGFWLFVSPRITDSNFNCHIFFCHYSILDSCLTCWLVCKILVHVDLTFTFYLNFLCTDVYTIIIRQVQKSDQINSDRQSGSDRLGPTQTNSDRIKK